MDPLHLVAHLNAAHTLDAFVGIAVEGKIPGPHGAGAGHQIGGVGIFENAQIIGHTL